MSQKRSREEQDKPSKKVRNPRVHLHQVVLYWVWDEDGFGDGYDEARDAARLFEEIHEMCQIAQQNGCLMLLITGQGEEELVRTAQEDGLTPIHVWGVSSGYRAGEWLLDGTVTMVETDGETSTPGLGWMGTVRMIDDVGLSWNLHEPWMSIQWEQ